MSLIVTMHRLAELRRESDRLREEWEAAKAALDATPEYKALEVAFATLRAKEAEVREAEEAARELAIGAYAETEDKHPAPAVTIKLLFGVQYDLDRAMAWCREYAPAFIVESLDRKSFERVAADLPGAPVKRIASPRAYIDKDLSAWLAEPTRERAPRV